MTPVVAQPVLVFALPLQARQGGCGGIGEGPQLLQHRSKGVVGVGDLPPLKVEQGGVLAVLVLVGQVQAQGPLHGPHGPDKGHVAALDHEATELRQGVEGIHVAVAQGRHQLLQLGDAGASHDVAGQHLGDAGKGLVAVQVAGAPLGQGILHVLPQKQGGEDRQAPQVGGPHEAVALRRVGVGVAGDQASVVCRAEQGEQAQRNGPAGGHLLEVLIACGLVQALPGIHGPVDGMKDGVPPEVGGLHRHGQHLDRVIEGAGGQAQIEHQGVHRRPPVGQGHVERPALGGSLRPQAHHRLVHVPDPVALVAHEATQLGARRLLEAGLGGVLEGPQGGRGAEGGAAGHVLLGHQVHHLLVRHAGASGVDPVEAHLAVHGAKVHPAGLHLLAEGLDVGLGGGGLVDRLLQLVLHPVGPLLWGVEPQRHRLSPGLHLQVGHQVEQVLELPMHLVRRAQHPQRRLQRDVVPQLLQCLPGVGVGLGPKHGHVGGPVLAGPLLLQDPLLCLLHLLVDRHPPAVDIGVAAEAGHPLEIGLLEHFLEAHPGHVDPVPVGLRVDLGRLDQAQPLQAAGAIRDHDHAVLQHNLEWPVEHHVDVAGLGLHLSGEAGELAVLGEGPAQPHGGVEPPLIEPGLWIEALDLQGFDDVPQGLSAAGAIVHRLDDLPDHAVGPHILRSEADDLLRLAAGLGLWGGAGGEAIGLGGEPGGIHEVGKLRVEGALLEHPQRLAGAAFVEGPVALPQQGVLVGGIGLLLERIRHRSTGQHFHVGSDLVHLRLEDPQGLLGHQSAPCHPLRHLVEGGGIVRHGGHQARNGQVLLGEGLGEQFGQLLLAVHLRGEGVVLG